MSDIIKPPTFIKIETTHDGGVLWPNTNNIFCVIPCGDSNHDGIVCRFMMTNGMVFYVTKLPDELKDWGKVS